MITRRTRGHGATALVKIENVSIRIAQTVTWFHHSIHLSTILLKEAHVLNNDKARPSILSNFPRYFTSSGKNMVCTTYGQINEYVNGSSTLILLLRSNWLTPYALSCSLFFFTLILFFCLPYIQKYHVKYNFRFLPMEIQFTRQFTHRKRRAVTNEHACTATHIHPASHYSRDADATW